MVKYKKKVLTSNARGTPIKTGEDSKKVQEFKKKAGLVTKDEIKRLPFSDVESLNRKIELLDRYATANQKLVDVFGSINGRVVNALNMLVDLQGKLWELEEECKLAGVSPLENPSWIKARDMLAKEAQFIHKHNLDVKDVRSKVDARKRVMGDDVMFEVEE